MAHDLEMKISGPIEIDVVETEERVEIHNITGDFWPEWMDRCRERDYLPSLNSDSYGNVEILWSPVDGIFIYTKVPAEQVTVRSFRSEIEDGDPADEVLEQYGIRLYEHREPTVYTVRHEGVGWAVARPTDGKFVYCLSEYEAKTIAIKLEDGDRTEESYHWTE